MAKKSNRGGSSLQDQLRQAGLVSEKQLRKAKNGLLRQEVRQAHGEVNENKAQALQAQKDKAERDRRENEARHQAAQAKALQSQIRQLIESNSQRENGEVAYKFVDQGKVKHVHVSEGNKQQLNRGFLGIVRLGDGYDLVPEVVVRRIQAREPNAVLYLYERTNAVPDEDDPYKDYPIPEDLEW